MSSLVPSRRMPIVTVSYKASAPATELDTLRAELPEIVSTALECDEEPYDGRLKPGDVNLKFAPILPADEALDYLVEVTTRWTRSRSDNLQERSDRIEAALGELGLTNFGVWLELATAAWSQR